MHFVHNLYTCVHNYTLSKVILQGKAENKERRGRRRKYSNTEMITLRNRQDDVISHLCALLRTKKILKLQRNGQDVISHLYANDITVTDSHYQCFYPNTQ